ncbi:unnamed protein product [Miscanthus lutarioriparius]|uniref:Uncharacterized protein n=1 Tax=Miscanthus lutarioriparius TaxID=422564 RepID=A0A811P542_9POAL|nr:unnamed protein product [Miscanthus lutarioriparius]
MSAFVLKQMCQLITTGVRTDKGFKEVHLNKVAKALQELRGHEVSGTCVYNHRGSGGEHRARPSQVTLDKDKSVASSNSSSIPGSLPARVDLNKLREAKRFAVLQAQHEGCLGSYESFDSLFGNYLVPVIPTNDFFDQVGTKP